MCEEGGFHVICVLAQFKKKKRIILYLQRHPQELQVAGRRGLVMGPEDVPQPRRVGGMSGTQGHSRHRSYYPTTLTHFSFFVRAYHSFSQMTQVRSDVQCHFERPPESPVPSDAAQAQHGPQGGRRTGSGKREDWRQSVGPESWASAVGLRGCQFCWNH